MSAGAGGREEGEATAGICYRGEDETGGVCLEEGTMEICVVRLSVSQPEWVVGSKGTPTQLGAGIICLHLLKWQCFRKLVVKMPGWKKLLLLQI